ncbi:TPA: DNA-directed RNA polymerase subunit beta [Candidatus Gastranaerophilales bacterium HUM_6]|nr:DNA-directed RNA polymerase subunit beta [bacterium]MEE0495434.1 DNA-directed RNA polymerase subunit beta [Cyanobacteriota bacterium]DAA90036.1 MAG TPA: DNA-directed RNA polymerase subunit beta [Candidatus Gastranaerophilales bacterium HUM_6]DAA93843.1 MAG TPA: DNA-directed RNA polymerase subunit beta [Candidatus Gastranaerophilales bacterium HUM_7]DAB02443.1 MAG TPA: DNA-directed RNA polymerase subunit beta [Candidatus Gastranaerophilales bacterium HUM_12]DAB07366.1 MAG TPA: DNA-directed R
MGIPHTRLDDLPDLIEVQKKSFEWFLKEGLKEELLSFSPIKDYTGRLELHFLPNYTFDNAKYTVEEARIHDATYAKQLRVMIRLVNRDSGEIKEQEVYIGDIPTMTDKGTFIVNGAERVIVSQIVRSPGVYFKCDPSPTGKRLYNATMIPNRGAWLKIETDSNDIIHVKIDKNRKILATTLLKAMGITVSEMESKFTHFEFLKKTLEKDTTETTDDALIELYKKLRPGDPASPQGGRQILESRFFDEKKYDIGRVGRYKLNKKLNLNIPKNQRTLTVEDIVSTIEYLINLTYDEGQLDDIDHLGNRRIRSVGELLQNQFRVGLSRIERIVKERMTLQDSETLTPLNLLNTKPLVASLKEFFGSSQLSQFMDQTNPLAELTHKRRISALGPGGLQRERAGFAVRDIHPSHYGRICPIETPEGPNAGLIGSLATHAKVNDYGFVESPFFVVKDGVVTNEVVYMTADADENYRCAPADVKLTKDRKFVEKVVPARYRSEFIMCDASKIDFVGVCPIQIISVATSMIPFIEHDDANRALMGSNMQRQAVPLLITERPRVGTGLESRVAKDSGMVIVADVDGTVERVVGEEIVIRDTHGKPHIYTLMKYVRSNQDTCINQKPIVHEGDKVKAGDVIADGASTCGGELSLGKNILVAYMPWEGYNFEDAILLSERCVHDDIFTSLHIEKLEIEARQTKLGPEEITREIPNVSEDALRHLDERGIVRIGARVYADDILVGKVTPKGESEHPPEEKLLRAIFAEKARDVKDNSLRVPHGEGGRVLDVKVFDREKGDELPPGANTVIRVYIAQKRKVSVGDKLSGRHGNKGIVSRILPKEDMPFLPDGTPVDIVLNPLGVPSRMNVGQTYELLLGLAAYLTRDYYEAPAFDEMYGENQSEIATKAELLRGIKESGCDWVGEDGKVLLIDGRTGEPFDRPVAVGWTYFLKLVHLVDDKIHARSTGPYSLVTQQPLGGKAQFGGQRFGEMEVWALEAYGAAYTLQEMLTIKSDDVNGRNRAYEAIVKGDNIPRPGIPESFKVLVRELQSIGLDITVAKKDGQEVDLMTDMDDLRKAAPKRTLSDVDSELLNINFFETPTTFGDL